MQIVELPIERIKPAAYNPRKDLQAGDPAFERLRKALATFDLVEPLVWNERSGNLVGGHQRFKILLARGDTVVPVSVVDLDDQREKQLNIALNKHSGEWDFATLADLLQELDAGNADMEASGFAQDELEKLMGWTPEPESKGPSFALYSQPDVIEAAFQYYRETGFPYRDLPVHVCQQQINALAAITNLETLQRTVEAYQVADTFHRHRFHSTAEGKTAPFDAFNDDKLLRRALTLELDMDGSRIGTGHFGALSIVSGVQACANFRPGFAAYIYRKFCTEGQGRVLDTSTGYGGRLIGALASQQVGEYVGIDPSTKTYRANLAMVEKLDIERFMKVRLINQPAEDVELEQVGTDFDLAFTSPPYFTKEHYSDEDTQSWIRYPDPEAWRVGFLLKMMELQKRAVKRDGHIVINIADVKIGNEKHPLIDWTIEGAATLKLRHEKTETFSLPQMPGKGMNPEEKKFEAVLVFSNKEPRTIAVSGSARRGKIELPPIEIEVIEGIHIVRDDLIPGGTKLRVLVDLLKPGAEYVYASPACGAAQVALAYAAGQLIDTSVTIFTAKRNEPHARTREAEEAGAKIVMIPMGYLSNVTAKAKAYVAQTQGAELVPFGLDYPEFRSRLAAIARSLPITPTEVWTVAGSGTLSRALQEAWPNAKTYAVMVGANSDVGRAERFDAPEKFEQDAHILPPFPSCSNYDAKAWRFIKRHASPGALFWNVAS